MDRGTVLHVEQVDVTVADGAAAGSSAANTNLASSSNLGTPRILGYQPTTTTSPTAQNPKSIVLNADGSVTVTLFAAAAGAALTFRVNVGIVQG